MALLGLETVFDLFPTVFFAVKTLGAFYLIWIAVQTWRAARRPLADTAQIAPAHAFRRGVAINLANPKSVLFSASVLVVIFPPSLGPSAIAFVTLNHFVVEVLVYSLLACALSRPTARRAYLSAKTHLDRIAALVLGGLGLRLLAERAS